METDVRKTAEQGFLSAWVCVFLAFLTIACYVLHLSDGFRSRVWLTYNNWSWKGRYLLGKAKRVPRAVIVRGYRYSDEGRRYQACSVSGLLPFPEWSCPATVLYCNPVLVRETSEPRHVKASRLEQHKTGGANKRTERQNGQTGWMR